MSVKNIFNCFPYKDITEDNEIQLGCEHDWYVLDSKSLWQIKESLKITQDYYDTFGICTYYENKVCLKCEEVRCNLDSKTKELKQSNEKEERNRLARKELAECILQKKREEIND